MRITIDGPVASGKTVVGRRVAQALGYRFLDTGAMYRAITWLAQQERVDPNDAAKLGELAQAAPIAIERPAVADGRDYTVRLAGRDITWEIRAAAVETAVSRVSQWPAVRQALVAQQRRIAADHQIVMVGRDIGTVVLPDAELKIYLTADAGERARRRAAELRDRGQDIAEPTIRADLERRDRLDSEREHSPLRPADDAACVDTTGLSIDGVVDRIIALAKGRA